MSLLLVLLVILASPVLADAQVTVSPPAPTFTGVQGGPRPAPIVVTVTGGTWTSHDTCSFFDTAPTSGAAGATQKLTPSSGWDVLPVGTSTCPVIYKSTGKPDRTVTVTGVKQAQVPATYPGPVSAPTAVRRDVVSWTLTWQDGAANGYQFEIERAATASGPFTRIGTVPEATTTYEDRTATPGYTYCYRVREQATAAPYSSVVCTPAQR
jgi:hypothetical protein